MLTDELLASLFDGQPHLLAEPMAGWLASSRRFTVFVNAYFTKIRKKLRTAQEPENLRDLQLELETAYLLLRERSLSLVYEPPHLEQTRGPDFAVSFTTSLAFMLEVTRIQAAPPKTPLDSALTSPLLGERFFDMLCSKLGQLLPQRSNILLVGLESPRLTQPEVRAEMLRIQQRSERGDAALLQRQGFRDRADFFHYYQRLSALLVRGIPLITGDTAVVWINPQAKYPLPTRVLTTISRSHTL
jgi:hypothetical protein